MNQSNYNYNQLIIHKMTASLLNSPAVKVVAAVGGGLFLAYCVYFDHKRRSDPLFKQKLRESKFSISFSDCMID